MDALKILSAMVVLTYIIVGVISNKTPDEVFVVIDREQGVIEMSEDNWLDSVEAGTGSIVQVDEIYRKNYLGVDPMPSIVTGSNNVAFGVQALASLESTGDNVIMIGDK